MFIIIYVICGYGIAFAHIYCAENCSLYEHNYLLWGIIYYEGLLYCSYWDIFIIFIMGYIYYGGYLVWALLYCSYWEAGK